MGWMVGIDFSSGITNTFSPSCETYIRGADPSFLEGGLEDLSRVQGEIVTGIGTEIARGGK